jgi:hypothetical protein
MPIDSPLKLLFLLFLILLMGIQLRTGIAFLGAPQRYRFFWPRLVIRRDNHPLLYFLIFFVEVIVFLKVVVSIDFTDPDWKDPVITGVLAGVFLIIWLPLMIVMLRREVPSRGLPVEPVNATERWYKRMDTERDGPVNLK